MIPKIPPLRPRVVVASHHKCASSFLNKMLFHYCWRRRWVYRFSQGSVKDGHFGWGHVAFLWNAEYGYCKRHCDQVINVIRHPLDILVSAYYSHLHYHPVKEWHQLGPQRECLKKLDKEAGLIATASFLDRGDMCDDWCGPFYALRRWDYDDPKFVHLKMEHLVDNPHHFIKTIFPNMNNEEAQKWADKWTFKRFSKGREVGEIDPASHYRSGRPNQWVDEVPPALQHAIVEQFRPFIERFYPETFDLMAK